MGREKKIEYNIIVERYKNFRFQYYKILAYYIIHLHTWPLTFFFLNSHQTYPHFMSALFSLPIVVTVDDDGLTVTQKDFVFAYVNGPC